MADRHECSATVFGPRVHSWQCQRAGVIERNGKWWCHQHNPKAKEARRKKDGDALDAKRRAENAIHAEGKRIASALGVAGDVYYHTFGPYSNHGPRRSLVISFEDCLKLVEMVRDAKRAVTPAASEAP